MEFGKYYVSGERYLSQEPPLGRNVVFTNKNGTEYERKDASQYFTEGETLIVKEIYVERSSSEVEFIEVPDKRFNTVLFSDVDVAPNTSFACQLERDEKGIYFEVDADCYEDLVSFTFYNDFKVAGEVCVNEQQAKTLMGQLQKKYNL